jgi:hypothetical protein
MLGEWYQKTNKTEDTNTIRRQSNNVWQLFCDRSLKRPLLTVSRSFMNVANRVLWRMAIILKAKKVNLFVYSVLFVFWYHSPNVLDTRHIYDISWLRVNLATHQTVINPLKAELNPSAQRCLPRFFSGILIFKRLTARRLYKSLGVKGLIHYKTLTYLSL